VFADPCNVRGLWDKHLEAMGEHYHHNNPCKNEVEQLVLIDVHDMLQSIGERHTILSSLFDRLHK
jgi:hypothetical protein